MMEEKLRFLPTNKQFIAAGFLSLLTLSCSDGKEISRPSEAKPDQDLGSSDAFGESISDEELLERLIRRNEEEKKEISLLKSINFELCAELDKFRAQCTAATRLIPQNSESILGCSGSSSNAKLDQTWTLTTANIVGNYYLEADKLYRSVGTFSNGTFDITWKSTGSEDQVSPRLLDISDLRIVNSESDGVAEESSLGLTLSLKVGEKVVFESDDVVLSDSNSSYFTINPNSIRELRELPECNVTQEDIDAIVDAVRAGGRGSSEPVDGGSDSLQEPLDQGNTSSGGTGSDSQQAVEDNAQMDDMDGFVSFEDLQNLGMQSQ